MKTEIEALTRLLDAASAQLDQSATVDGLANCDTLASARAALEKLGGPEGTPGPWKPTVYHNSETGATRICIESGAPPYNVAQVYADNMENAHLIAAAPQLLQALQGMLEWARRVGGRNPGLEVANAHNAVKRATTA